jgi:hypothetical protein
VVLVCFLRPRLGFIQVLLRVELGFRHGLCEGWFKVSVGFVLGVISAWFMYIQIWFRFYLGLV